MLLLTGLIALPFISFILAYQWTAYQGQQKSTEREKILSRYSFLEAAGWRHIDSFVFSEARSSYSGFEFPLVLNKTSRKGDTFEVQFLAVNKTAAPLRISAHFNSDEKGASIIHSKYADDLLTHPMQSTPVIINADITHVKSIDKLHIIVRMQFGEGNILSVLFYPFH